MVMPLEIFGFLKFSVTDMLDVLLVALLIYFIFRWIRDSAAMNIFTAIISIYVLRVIADALKMKLVSALLGTFIDVGVLAVIIKQFQIRRRRQELPEQIPGERSQTAGQRRGKRNHRSMQDNVGAEDRCAHRDTPPDKPGLRNRDRRQNRRQHKPQAHNESVLQELTAA